MESRSGSLSEQDIAVLLLMATRAAARWCRTPFDAEDVAQEAVLRLLECEVPPANAYTWLFVVTRRLAGRAHSRDVTRLRAEAEFAAVAAAEPQPDLLLDVGRVLSALGARDRRLLMRVAEGVLSFDIAREFGCEVRDVGQMVARARRKARRAAEGTPSSPKHVRKTRRRGS